MSSLYTFGIGVGTKNARGEWLEVYYPAPLVNLDPKMSRVIRSVFSDLGSDIEPSPEQLASLVSALESNNFNELASIIRTLQTTDKCIVAVLQDKNLSPKTVPQGYLKLHLLSHRLVKPHQTDISGIFGVLKNIAWTSFGAIDIEELPERMLESRLSGTPLIIDCVDKFPKMVDYVVPTGIRIADTSRVRLGAYVGEGTTVMHEGFINFNAGTEGPNMVEGRISAGVFCGSGSDVGGGASIMGTLSGGGTEVISLGRQCLLGANSGSGISLGDRCTIEAGLYVTGGTIITILDDNKNNVRKAKARELSGQSDLLFRRNSVTGAVECLTNLSAIELNSELHS
jgi:2,3,4,5-tetrahydropyridine-2-carboxylate N-succinyltransferase|tara:strand:- start:214 stop:1236 length:1023 start_codon:yes stop_codon:yes gene_type:complete